MRFVMVYIREGYDVADPLAGREMKTENECKKKKSGIHPGSSRMIHPWEFPLKIANLSQIQELADDQIAYDT
jgi:hypothetical protein